jgi:hypothetical protein
MALNILPLIAFQHGRRRNFSSPEVKVGMREK